MKNLNHMHRDPYGCTCEDLLSLISLMRDLDDKETVTTPSQPTPNLQVTGYPSNFEELIMKLVNALVYTTTQATQNKCQCSHSSSGSSQSATTSSSNSHGSSGGGLIDLGLLNSNKKNNVLDVGLGGTSLLGVGLGGKDNGDNRGSQNSYNNGGRQDNSGINLDLLNSNSKNNVADLGIGKQNVLGVGLGADGGNNNAGSGLVNLDLLNPNKDGNVVDLDLNKQHLLGVGLGN